jgi:hypothetical protein
MIKKYGISFRKLSIILLILVVLGYIVAAITVISRFIDQTCAYQKLPEVISLDGTYTVKVTDMTCPTTQFRTDVQIFKLKNKSIIPLLNKSDVFAFNGVVYNVENSVQKLRTHIQTKYKME